MPIGSYYNEESHQSPATKSDIQEILCELRALKAPPIENVIFSGNLDFPPAVAVFAPKSTSMVAVKAFHLRLLSLSASSTIATACFVSAFYVNAPISYLLLILGIASTGVVAGSLLALWPGSDYDADASNESQKAKHIGFF